MNMMSPSVTGAGVSRGGQIAAGRKLLKLFTIKGLLPMTLEAAEGVVVNEHLRNGAVIGDLAVELMSPEFPRYFQAAPTTAPAVVVGGYELGKPGTVSDCFDFLGEHKVDCDIPLIQGIRVLMHAGALLGPLGGLVVFRTKDDNGRPFLAGFSRTNTHLFVSRISRPHKSRLKIKDVVLTVN